MLMKFTPTGVNFTNVLRAAITHADPKSKEDRQVICIILHFWDLHVQKLLIKHW